MMNKYEFYSKLLQEDFPVKYRQDFAEHDSEQCKKIADLKAQVEEAMDLLKNLMESEEGSWAENCQECAVAGTPEWKKLEAFLARHAQAEQNKPSEYIGPHGKELLAHIQAEQQEAQGAQVETSSSSHELEEFEKWRHTQADSLRRCGYPDAADKFIQLGSVQWAGWQARAALATQPSVPKANEFHLGIFYAVAELQRSFEMTTMCAAILRAAGLDDADCSSVDEFDRVSLREIAALSSLKLTGLDGQPAERGHKEI